MDERYHDSLRNVDIDEICTKIKIGTEAIFTDAIVPLKKMIKEIVELEDLDYLSKLPSSDINSINSARKTITKYVNEIKDFSLDQSQPIDQKNNIVNAVENFYQNSFSGLIRQSLLYLRSQIKETAEDETRLKELVLKTEDIAKTLEARSAAISEQERKLEEDRKSLSDGRGVVSASYLSKQFSEEANEASKKADNWDSKWVFRLSVSLVVLIIIIFCGYFFWIRKFEDKYLSIEYTVLSTSLIALLFFFLRIVLRNSNVEKHTASLNRHRSNVASTLENLLSIADHDQSLKESLLKEGSNAMFSIGSTGYLDKEQMEISTPAKEVFTTLISNK